VKNNPFYKLIPLLFYFYCNFLFTQNRELDSLYNTIQEIENIKDYQKFKYFSNQIIELNETFKKDIYNSKYNDLFYKALVWAKEQSDNSLVLDVKFYMLNYYYQKSNYNKFITAINELIQNNNFKKTKKIVPTLVLLSNYYLQTEQFAELLNLYPLMYEQIEKHGFYSDRINRGYKNEEIAFVYYRLGDYKKSRQYYKLSKQAYIQKNQLKTASADNNIGLTFSEENELDSANYYFNKALSTLKINLKDPEITRFISVVYGNKASILVKQKKYDEALPFFLNELKKNKDKGSDYETVRTAYSKLANLYYEKNDIKTTLKYLDSLKSFLEKHPSVYVQQKFLNLKAKCLLINNNFPLANKYFKKYKMQIDSIESIRINQRYQIAKIKFENKKRDKELLLNKQNLVLQKITNKYQNIGLVLLGFILIGFILFIIKIIYDNKIIVAQKISTQQALEEQNILLKEVHHRVKNNLQIIASILDLQNTEINNKKLKNILEDGQNRIQSIALIHQQLYQSENISDISIDSYINTLINHIATSNSNPNICFKINTNNIRFSINTAVPLGLIINELITNIYKHAFNKFEKGNVFIEITKTTSHLFKLIISDNGKGLPRDFNLLSNKSLGLKLVKILTHQLKGKIKIAKNATFIIEFRDDVAV